MTSAIFDPVDYKAEQRRGWDLVAQGWNTWWPAFEHGAQSVSDRMVELAEIAPGKKVLDVATGIGEPAITAARRAGAEGRVIATDLSPQMIAIGRTRARELELTNIEFRILDAESAATPHFEEQPFDAILCRWGLMFFPDVHGTLRRLRELLVPGGRFVGAVWDVPGRVPLLGLREEKMKELLRLPPPHPARPHAFALADPRVLEELLVRAGFDDVESERMTAVFAFESATAFARFQEDVSGPRIPELAARSPEFRAHFWQEIARAAHPYADSTGRIEMPNDILCVTGRREGRDENDGRRERRERES